MDKILTIIIPTYNMEGYLKHCLESLIVPQMDNIEVLIINDGSTDSSSAIAHNYQDKYSNTFRVIDKVNGNYGSCINRGLKEATGKYIKVLDADDSFDSNNFEKYLDYISSCDVDLVLNDFVEITPQGIITKEWKGRNLPTKEAFSFQKLYNGNIMMHAVAYKTQNIKSIKGGYHQTEGISYTDQEWIFLPMTTVKTVGYFNKVLYKYLVGRDGQTMDKKTFAKNMWMEAKGEQVMIKEYQSLPENVNNKEYLIKRLEKRAEIIYLKYLLENKFHSDFDLYKFDLWIKENAPKFYEIIGDIGFHSNLMGDLPVVRSWRNGNKLFWLKFKIWQLYVKLRTNKKNNETDVVYFDK